MTGPRSHWFDLLAESVEEITPTDESIAGVIAEIDGHRCVLIVNDFEHFAGTMSVAAGERFVASIDAAIDRCLPVVAIANSGGTRMQEGTRAFVQMVYMADAVERLRAARLAFVVHCVNPTTGGVLASWASAGTFITAEPGAVIGFTGPRVAAALGEPIQPESTQTAEGKLAAGQIDAVVERDDLRPFLSSLLTVLSGQPRPRIIPPAPADGMRGWDAVAASRSAPPARVLHSMLGRSEVSIPLRGDRRGATDEDLYCGFTMVDGRAFMLIAHTAGAAGTPTRVTAAALRVARRAIKVAESLVLPVVTLIDTDGALLSGEAENAAIGGEISRSLSLLTSVETTVVSVIAGRGTGGAALAWFPADVALAATESWLGPIAPEAASLILHRSRDRAREMADLQGVGSAELCEAGIVDAVYRWEDLVDATLCALDDLKALPRESRGTKRRLKFASIG